jgi:hypothetical protein
MAQAIGTTRQTVNRWIVITLAGMLIAAGIVGVVARVSTSTSPLVVEGSTVEPAVLQARAAVSMGEGLVGGALVDISPKPVASFIDSDALWAIEAQQELAQAQVRSPLRAHYHPSMGQGFTCECLVDITPRLAPMVPPYGEGTDY